MTKSQLIEALAKAEGITLKAAEVAVNVVFQSMEDALARGDRLEIRGFGSFKVKCYECYKGRNPKSGEIIEVKPKKLPFFKVGKELKERVNDSTAPLSPSTEVAEGV
ncbi:MAG: HU family DNA-binding protein [Syntrophobacteraceae bacterium]|jgi:integration host factor subunit beta